MEKIKIILFKFVGEIQSYVFMYYIFVYCYINLVQYWISFSPWIVAFCFKLSKDDNGIQTLFGSKHSIKSYLNTKLNPYPLDIL